MVGPEGIRAGRRRMQRGGQSYESVTGRKRTTAEERYKREGRVLVRPSGPEVEVIRQCVGGKVERRTKALSLESQGRKGGVDVGGTGL